MSEDLLVMNTDANLGSGIVSMDLLSNPHTVSGIQSLIQRFTTLLLRKYDPRTGLGTNLLSTLFGGGVADAQIQNLTGLSILEVREQMPNTGDLSEQLLDARVLSARKILDGVNISIEITSRSGEVVEFVIPRIVK